jgi:hypothetical protein
MPTPSNDFKLKHFKYNWQKALNLLHNKAPLISFLAFIKNLFWKKTEGKKCFLTKN